MGTPYDVVYGSFLDKVKDFYTSKGNDITKLKMKFGYNSLYMWDYFTTSGTINASNHASMEIFISDLNSFSGTDNFYYPGTVAHRVINGHSHDGG